MNLNKLAAARAQADAFLAARAGWSGGMSMDVTRPADVPEWTPGVIDAAFYDRLDDPTLGLTALAARYNELEGRPGERIRIPTDTVTTPAANLAIDVPAVDDALGSDAFELTIKEAVKSIAWYDRTSVQSSQNIDQIAGRKVGTAVLERVELDLGAALVAGRNTSADETVSEITADLFLDMQAKIPSRLRKRGLAIVASDVNMTALYKDPLFKNAAAYGSDDVIRTGALSRPLYGVSPYTLDDGVLPNATIGGTSGPVVVMFALGMLAYGFQRAPRTEQERDARARLTRHVGTCFHGEGTLEAAGIVAARITG